VEHVRDSWRAQTAEFLGRMVTGFDGQKITRLETIQFIQEHELRERSQLFVYPRLKGIVLPTTRRRQAKQAGK
jgi:hypothetical protein